VRSQRLCVVPEHDDHIVDARRAQLGDLVLDERAATPGQQRLRPPHAPRFSRGEQDGSGHRC
jgi:hypothetical protein